MSTFRVTSLRGSSAPQVSFRVTRLRGSAVSSATFRITSLRGSSAPRVSFRITRIVGTTGTLVATITWPTVATAGDTVVIDASSSPAPYTFTQTSGPTVTLTVVGGVATYEVPDLALASSISILVTAGSATATATTMITPVSEYDLETDGTWTPRRRSSIA